MSGARVQTLVALTAGAVVSALALALPDRGWTLWGLWQAEAVEAFAALRSGGDEAAAWNNAHGVWPLVPRVLAWLSGDDPDAALRVLSALSAGATAAAVALWACIARRWVAGLFAVGALLAVPLFWDVASSRGPTAFATALLSWICVSTWRGRDDPRWAAVALALICVGLQASLYAWFLLLPLAWIVLAQPSPRVGQVTLRPVSVVLLLAPIIALVVLCVTNAWLHEDTAERLGLWLSRWLERPGEPFLWGGERYGPIRIPWWLPGWEWFVRMPPFVAVAALAGLIASMTRCAPADDTEAMRLTRVMLVAAWALPVALRAPDHAGHHLLAFGLVPLSVAAGVFVHDAAESAARSLPTRHVRVAALSLAAVAGLAPGFFASASAWPTPEAYVSGLAGGPVGRVTHGASRFTHPPLLPEVAEAVRVAAPSGRVYIASDGWEMEPLLRRWAADEAPEWPLSFTSRLPVGSSATMSSGSFSNALAIAILCCSPPDIWYGNL